MSKRFLIVLAILAVLFGGFVWFSKMKQAKAPSGGANSKVTNHVQGAGNKKVTLVEYGDFECSHCGEYYPYVEAVRQKYGDDITFQFRNFPLVQIHPNAMAAHRAAEAADKQGKFWEMYNVLYQQQSSWSTSNNAAQIMEAYATQLGLNIDQFRADVASSDVNDKINADIKTGQSLGIGSTPTFFINGKKVEPLPAKSVEAFSALIDNAIAETSPQTQQQPTQ